MDPLSIARYGMMSAQDRLAKSAARIAGGGDDVDLASETVEQIKAKTQFEASAKVVSFAEEMWRSLMAIQSA
jgi:flagellar hook protein FlgE